MKEPKRIGEIIGEIMAKMEYPEALIIESSSEEFMSVGEKGDLHNTFKVNVKVNINSSESTITIVKSTIV